MFIHDDFLLGSETARRLFHDFAKDLPIIDYHNHLSPKTLAENCRFKNLFDLWIDGDHYKWRAMRTNGVHEDLITGSASPKEKFLAFAQTVPATLRNPLFHWTHLELKRYFDIEELLNESNAESIWDRCNEQIAERHDLTPQGILKRFNVTALCTTDDPTDDLEHHRAMAQDSKIETAVYPAFRPDAALAVERPRDFNTWIGKLENATGESIDSLSSFVVALENRHDFFHSLGCRLSDHGCEHVPANFCLQSEASSIFDAARTGQAANSDQAEQFATFLLLELARMDAKKDWTNQLHTGVFRNNNSRLFQAAGKDIGCDSIGDSQQGKSLGRFLDRLDKENELPKTIVYNLNPADNYLICTMIGNFQGGIAGKMQYGSGWWYLDQQEAMEWQLNTLSNTGLLSKFIGMLTDSRSFMSFTRHEYFRRILCNMIGRDVENGSLPNDDSLIGNLIADVCYFNAKNFLALENS